MSEKDENQKQTGANATETKTTPPAKKKAKRKRGPKDEATSVNLKMDDLDRIKLMNLNRVQQRSIRGHDIPLSASLRYALDLAHEYLFGDAFNEDPDGAYEDFDERTRRNVRRQQGQDAPEQDDQGSGILEH